MKMRLPIPGGSLPPEAVTLMAALVQTEPQCTFRLAMRQGIDIYIPDTPATPERTRLIDALTRLLEPETYRGFTVTACPGAPDCRNANAPTRALARQINRMLAETGYYITAAVSGCMNDCGQLRLQNIGVIAQTRPVIDAASCTGCGKCAAICSRFAAAALQQHSEHDVPLYDPDICNGCGLCVSKANCASITRDPILRFALYLFGNTAKGQVREGTLMAQFLTEDALLNALADVLAFLPIPDENDGAVHRKGLRHLLRQAAQIQTYCSTL